MYFVKWRLKLFILYLLFYSAFSAPIGKRPGSDDEAHGGKRTKQNEENEDYESCYFNKLRTTDFETRQRSSLTSIDEQCSGSLISFAVLVKNADSEFTDLGAPNEAAIVLARGAGEFPDFNNQDTVNEISQRKICPFHLKDLSRDWEKSRHVKRKYNKLACSVPPTSPTPLIHMFTTNAIYGSVSYLAAQAVLQINGTLIHVGAPRCQAHRNMITTSLEIYQNKNAPVTKTPEVNETPSEMPELLPERKAKINAPSYKEEPMEDDEHIYEVAETVKNIFFDLLTEMGLPKSSISKKWRYLKRSARYSYISVLNKIYDTAALILGGKDNHEKLKEAAVEKLQPENRKNVQNKLQEELLQELKMRFYTAESTDERRSYLSLFVEVLPLKVIERFIPDLNPYQYTEAKKMARRRKSHQQKPVRGYKEVIKKSQVEKFVSFFTSFSTGIPFGRIKMRLKNKNILELPATVRDLRNSKIVQKYKIYMAEKGEEIGMSDSTMIKILKACPAKRKVSLRAVDEQKANGIMAFEWVVEIISDMEHKNILRKDEAEDFKDRLKEDRTLTFFNLIHF